MSMNTYVYIRKYTLLLLAVVMMVGCKKEKIEEVGEQPLQEGASTSVNIEAHFELPDNLQKSFLKDGYVEWEDGDQILLNNRVCTIHRHEGGVGFFREEVSTYNNPGTGENEWFAIYPKELAKSQTQMLRNGNSRQFYVTIPQTQVYQEVDESNGKYLKDMNYMVAYTKTMTNNSITLQFVNLCAVLKIGLKSGANADHVSHLLNTPNTRNANVKKIVLYTSQSTDAAFWGVGYVNQGTDAGFEKTTDNLNSLPKMQIQMGDSYKKNKNRKLILDCTKKKVKNSNGTYTTTNLTNGVELSGSTTWFYIMVPINLISKTLSSMCIEVYDGNGNMMKKVLQNAHISRNGIYTCDMGQLQCQYSASSFIDADFSVDEKHTVKFTSGNLQYQCSTKVWRFAPNQWSRIGMNNEKIADDYDGYIDLFGYGTSGVSHLKPYFHRVDGTTYSYYYKYNSSSKNWTKTTATWTHNNANFNSRYDNEFPPFTISKTNYDLGWYNNISGHPQKAFFIWDKDNALYLLNSRSASKINGTSNARYAMANVNGINGILLFPDVCTLPSNLSNVSTSNINNGSTTAPYNGVTWSSADLESAGVVFLPCAGWRNGKAIQGGSGYSYTKDFAIKNIAYYMMSCDMSSIAWHTCVCAPVWSGDPRQFIATSSSAAKHTGRSVRLILSNY